MELKKSALQFQNYIVNQLSYSVVPDFQTKNGETFDLNPQFVRKITKVNEDEYALTIDLQIGGERQKLPFIIAVSITGNFMIDQNSNDPDRTMKLNATSILFPYVRALLTMLSNMASIPPIILPPMNFSEMVKAEEDCLEKLEHADISDTKPL